MDSERLKEVRRSGVKGVDPTSGVNIIHKPTPVEMAIISAILADTPRLPQQDARYAEGFKAGVLFERHAPDLYGGDVDDDPVRTRVCPLCHGDDGGDPELWCHMCDGSGTVIDDNPPPDPVVEALQESDRRGRIGYGETLAAAVRELAWAAVPYKSGEDGDIDRVERAEDIARAVTKENANGKD